MRENDKTQGMAEGAVIIAAIRSGGTFLSHCLSNHPQVYCARGEPLHHHSVWVRTLHPDRRELLAAMLNQTGYKVSMCKLTYAQATNRAIWPWLAERQPRVIWLRRQNRIRQAVSVLINKAARHGEIKRPQHTFRETGPVRVTFPPETILKMARRLKGLDSQVGKRVNRMRHLYSTVYADVVGGEHSIADELPERARRKVCVFLGVRSIEPLRCDLKRVNPYPLREMLGNWKAVEAAVRRSEFAACLEDEQGWA